MYHGSMVQYRPLARGVSGCLLDTLLLIFDTLIHIFCVFLMQWDEKKLDTQFTPNVYFWTPNSEILAKALVQYVGLLSLLSYTFNA